MTDLPYDDDHLKLTRHASLRMEQRAVNPDALNILCRHGDLRRLSGGCERVRMSRRMAKRLDRDRSYPRRLIEAAHELEAVVAEDARCVTTWRLVADPRFRRTGARPSRTRVRRDRDE